jgi:YD repeat-containing protein
VTYDALTDTLTVLLRDAPARVSEEERPGAILDYDADGRLIAIEILDASRGRGRRHRATPGHP